MANIQLVPTIVIVSGGVGASGEQLVHTVLAQFPGENIQVTTIGNVRQTDQVRSIVEQAQQKAALLVYTLVDPALLGYLLHEARRMQVQAVDLMGPILEWVANTTGVPPVGQPGLYRQLHREYFDRVAAIDFTIKHDDGKSPEDWSQAEAVIIGVSRVGKTPLSVYLAVLGWKVANYPIVPEIAIPDELFKLEPHRVFGLTIEPGQLIQYRAQRQRQLGAPGTTTYIDPKAVYDEIEAALKIFRRGRFSIINMTDKTIELGADEIIRLHSRRSDFLRERP